jgi:hypothetical protein
MWLEEFHFDGLRVDSVKTLRRRDPKLYDTEENFAEDMLHAWAFLQVVPPPKALLLYRPPKALLLGICSSAQAWMQACVISSGSALTFHHVACLVVSLHVHVSAQSCLVWWLFVNPLRRR